MILMRLLDLRDPLFKNLSSHPLVVRCARFSPLKSVRFILKLGSS
jgi:hypothetical protein